MWQYNLVFDLILSNLVEDNTVNLNRVYFKQHTHSYEYKGNVNHFCKAYISCSLRNWIAAYYTNVVYQQLRSHGSWEDGEDEEGETGHTLSRS